jgi:hypothetical protein|tara:strand:+ start:16595 stop:18058 length:1464 start_codon:yes stop_codon:yes gene_type:complete
MRDAYKGERQVKSKNTVYLPMTSSQIADGGLNSVESLGYRAYMAYKMRARFPNFTREAIQQALGMMHSQPPEIKLPKAMEKITSRMGEPLKVVLQKINKEQLLTGRVGVMADLPTNPEPGEDIPYLATYLPERIINWDDGRVEQIVPQRLNLVVINESEYERNSDFSWTAEEKYRVLVMGDILDNETSGLYQQGVFDETNFDPSKLIAPTWRGRTLNKIPFVFINSCDITPDVDDPPLLDLGNMCMAIYRSEADYRQNLFMQGQDTFVTIGGGWDETDEVRVGAGARIDLPQGGDAKYVGVTSAGLSEQRQALENLEMRAGSMGAQTLDSVSRERESGDSLRIRMAARTADLNTIADTGAAGLEQVLKICAEWMDEDPSEVSVIPNKEFGEMPLTGQTMVEIATARNLGWPISAKSMHDLSRKRRMTTKTFEEEIAEAEKEAENEDFVFAKKKDGDRAALQPNDPNDPDGENNVPGQTTNPSGRDAQ